MKSFSDDISTKEDLKALFESERIILEKKIKKIYYILGAFLIMNVILFIFTTLSVIQ